MSEMNESRSNEKNEIEKIDLSVLVERLLHGIGKVGWLVVLLTVAFAAFSYFDVTTSYVPQYIAEATLTISASSSDELVPTTDYTDIATTQQLGKVFPYILTSGVLSDLVAQDLGMDSIPGSISVEAVENTNMLTISVTASDGQMAYDILQSVIKNYPEVAQFVVGQTYVTILDDSGVPSDSGQTSVTRGSMRNGALKGFGLGMLILLLYVATRRTIRYSSDFKSLLNIPCLGTLPQNKLKKRRKNKDKAITIFNKNISQEYLEALRAIRTRVERKMENEGKKSILITSSVPGEGKTTIALNLAASFAQKGKKVILVDCDLRSPSLQERLSVNGKFPGIASVLAGTAELSDALYQMPDKNIDMKILFGNKKASQNVEILGGNEMKELLTQLESMADLVILDTAPSAMLADALVMARHVPMALYVVKYDYAKVRDILEGIEELSDTGIHIVGCILNEGQYGTQAGYGGYGRYGRYGKYGYSRSKYYAREESKAVEQKG